MQLGWRACELIIQVSEMPVAPSSGLAAWIFTHGYVEWGWGGGRLLSRVPKFPVAPSRALPVGFFPRPLGILLMLSCRGGPTPLPPLTKALTFSAESDQ